MDGQVLRREYLDTLLRFRDQPGVVKIITGMRRCGKSTLMRQFISALKDSGVDEDRIIYLDMEDLDNFELRDGLALHKYLRSKKTAKRPYILLDEVQNISMWEEVVASEMVALDADVYLTGSNAYFLSTELSTYLTGRSVSIHMMPLSFKEFMELNGYTDIDAGFDDYLLRGSLPLINDRMNTDDVYSILRSVRSDIVLRDIASRKKLTDIGTLQKIVDYLFSEIGNPISANSIAKSLKMDNKTVDNYLTMIAESLIFYQTKRYDLKGRTILTTSSKYYCTDMGMRNSSIAEYGRDSGRTLENIVFLELLRRGYSVTVGKLGDLEIDFVADKSGNREYFQVALTVSDKNVLERELRPMLDIRDNLEKTLLTADPVLQKNIDGIKHYNVKKWLLGDVD
jgi:predicted AAA+ superfamily ATPase